MAINYKQCPKCGLKNSLKIIYGMPTYEVFERAKAGEFKLGGCCIIESNPEYYCKDCEYEWNRVQAIDAAYGGIKKLKASVGGYFGGYYYVDIDLITRRVSWSHWGDREEDTIHKTIRPATAKRLVDELKLVSLLDWKAKYIEPGICDGTHWSIELIKDGRDIKKYGNNKFPEEWDAFCSIIRWLVNKQFR